MTTAAQVKALLRPLLEKHPDLALVKRLIVRRPVHHVLCGILIDGTSNPDGISPRWLASHFFTPSGRLHLSWGDLLNEPRHGYWDLRRHDIQGVLVATIEEEALPQLQGLAALPEFITFVSHHYFRHHLFDEPETKLVLDVALGNLDAAREVSRTVIAQRSVDDPRLDAQDRAHLTKVKRLCALLEEDDRAGMGQMLHAWEAETVRNLKLDHLWEPTPFPLEAS